MAQISDLLKELMVEILSRVPLTSLRDIRSTCKKWNTFSKNLVPSKIEKQFLGFMMMDYKLCSIQFDLQGLHNDEEEFNPKIKQVALFDEIEISKVFHCNGLLLCVIKEKQKLLLWNPYLGETKWILPRKMFHKSDKFAFGCDKKHNHKILRLFSSGYEIYDLHSDSWSVFDLPPNWNWIVMSQQGFTLKGHIYFIARTNTGREDILLCFDLTSERFGQPLPLPFGTYICEATALSCVGEDKLAVLHWYTDLPVSRLDIWVTNKLNDDDDPKETISWSNFLHTFSLNLFYHYAESFFIDEEKEVAVVFGVDNTSGITTQPRYQKAHLIGQDGFFKSVNFGEAPSLAGGWDYCVPYVCSSYVPSLVHL